MTPRLINIVLGVWLTAAPGVLGYADPARTNDHIVGPLAATFACVACWEATRAVRWANVLVGVWLVLAPWVLGYEWGLTLHSTAVGALLAALASVRGAMKHRFGGGWSALWRPAAGAA